MIKSIRIINWHRIDDSVITLDKNFNILSGENGSGKTTILDALIYVLTSNMKALGKSGNADSRKTLDSFRRNLHVDSGKYERDEDTVTHIMLELTDGNKVTSCGIKICKDDEKVCYSLPGIELSKVEVKGRNGMFYADNDTFKSANETVNQKTKVNFYKTCKDFLIHVVKIDENKVDAFKSFMGKSVGARIDKPNDIIMNTILEDQPLDMNLIANSVVTSQSFLNTSSRKIECFNAIKSIKADYDKLALLKTKVNHLNSEIAYAKIVDSKNKIKDLERDSQNKLELNASNAKLQQEKTLELTQLDEQIAKVKTAASPRDAMNENIIMLKRSNNELDLKISNEESLLFINKHEITQVEAQKEQLNTFKEQIENNKDKNLFTAEEKKVLTEFHAKHKDGLADFDDLKNYKVIIESLTPLVGNKKFDDMTPAQKIECLNDKIDELSSKISTCGSKINQHEDNIADYKKLLEDNKQEITEKTAMLEKVTESSKDEMLNKYLEKKNAIQIQINDIIRSSGKFDSDIEKNRSDIEQLNKNLQEMESTFDYSTFDATKFEEDNKDTPVATQIEQFLGEADVLEGVITRSLIVYRDENDSNINKDAINTEYERLHSYHTSDEHKRLEKAYENDKKNFKTQLITSLQKKIKTAGETIKTINEILKKDCPHDFKCKIVECKRSGKRDNLSDNFKIEKIVSETIIEFDDEADAITNSIVDDMIDAYKSDGEISSDILDYKEYINYRYYLGERDFEDAKAAGINGAKTIFPIILLITCVFKSLYNDECLVNLCMFDEFAGTLDPNNSKNLVNQIATQNLQMLISVQIQNMNAFSNLLGNNFRVIKTYSHHLDKDNTNHCLIDCSFAGKASHKEK
ncbi:MAG: hypothetical protein Ta2E_06050 [Mycoplasmoidaceae bacterium]|nr:MAG: hypothetical protein Ta2E_06050 [Mycoplasmoidaceae bacterium]